MERIAIVTQPLLNNYGGLLQNFALQKILQQLKYDALTIDFQNIEKQTLKSFICSWMRFFFTFILTKKNQNIARKKNASPRKKWSEAFISSYIKKTKICSKYNNHIIEKNHINIILVGSDQVWRPKYNNYLYDMFLDFCKKNKNIKRIAYAASFGVDEWEYTSEQTQICSALARKFNSISVREESGIQLCKHHLNTDATWVLDPTLLISPTEYLDICKDIPKSSEKILVAYILDASESIQSHCEAVAREKNLKINFFEAGAKATLTIPEWLSMFRDATYIITDSFHGIIFSIIFNKTFQYIPNDSRGVSRIHSILKLHNMGKIDEMRQKSLNWLKKALTD